MVSSISITIIRRILQYKSGKKPVLFYSFCLTRSQGFSQVKYFSYNITYLTRAVLWLLHNLIIGPRPKLDKNQSF